MKPLLPSISAALFAPLLLLSCASPTAAVAARRAKVPDFSLSAVQVDPQAYREPDAKWAKSPSNAPEYVHLLGGGLIPALLAAAISEEVQLRGQEGLASQQRRFEETQAGVLPVLNSLANQPPVAAVEAAVTAAMKENRFLAPRIRTDAANVLEARIVRFGLAKRDNVEESDPPMVAQILVTLSLRSPQGPVIALGGYSGSSRDSVRISGLLRAPDIMGPLYGQAADSLREVLRGALSRKFDEDAAAVPASLTAK